jgi:hypothetical protein
VLTAAGALAVLTVLDPSPAQAIPAFARKYETSCETCHTIYPRLNPFGEAFRRNGYRFPGVDSDLTKVNNIPMGQPAYKDVFPNAVWPSWIAGNLPIAFGVNGQITLHPDTNSSAGKADNGTLFSMADLVGEAHFWGGGSFDDTISFFTELTLSSDGVEIEHAKVIFNDLIGPKHAFNVQVGKSFQTLTSFGMHSSYASDARMLAAPVPSLMGASSDTWNVMGEYSGIEATGVIGGSFDYSLGLNAGSNVLVKPTENFYVHLGFKLGGLALDGEDSQAADPGKPWEEDALTVDVFAAHSNTFFNVTADDGTTSVQSSVGLTLGAALRAQLGSLELDAGGYSEKQNHGALDGSEVNAFVQFDELSYIVYPWLVPALRFEYVTLSNAGTTVNNWKIIPAVAALIRPNLKLLLVGQIESAKGLPGGGSWDPIGGAAAPADATSTVNPEIESVMLQMAWAF